MSFNNIKRSELPPSANKILNLLDGGEVKTHKDLVKESNLASRTVRYALKRLKEKDLIIERFNFRDARQILYQKKERGLKICDSKAVFAI